MLFGYTCLGSSLLFKEANCPFKIIIIKKKRQTTNRGLFVYVITMTTITTIIIITLTIVLIKRIGYKTNDKVPHVD